MGMVYEAVQESLDRRVALKVLRPELAEDPEFAARFRREGRLQASVEHPHVLDVYEVGESDHGLFLSMRLVSGKTLLDLLRNGELDALRSIRLLGQVTDALDAAHRAGLVHRDVKPQNVLVGDDDHAFLADFGLTRGTAETTVAASAPLLGSVAYVAPEIVRGEEPTPASDRYSFAATLFHCLTGDVIYPRGSDAAVLYAHAAEPPPRASERRPELPRALDDVFGAALAKQPEARPDRASTIVDDAREAMGSSLTEIGSPDLAAPPVRTAGELGLPRIPPATSSLRRTALLAGALVVLAGVAVGASAALSDDDGNGTTPEVSLPAVDSEAQALGSELAIPDRSLDCMGEMATPRSRPCSIVQSELPGREVLIPEDGAIVGWAVRGAKGELALDVIRPRGEETVRVARSQWEVAGNVAPHRYETNLAVEAGDQLGLQLGPGARIGVSENAGATTERWFEPTGGFYGEADRASGTGFDFEVAFRAEFIPGAEVPLPKHLTGEQAARAPDGVVRDKSYLTVDKPDPVRLRVELVEVGDRVAVDAFHNGRRNLRVFVPGLVPGGIPVDLKTVNYPGDPYGEVDVWWVNPNSSRSQFKFFNLGKGDLEFAG